MGSTQPVKMIFINPFQLVPGSQCSVFLKIFSANYEVSKDGSVVIRGSADTFLSLIYIINFSSAPALTSGLSYLLRLLDSIFAMSQLFSLYTLSSENTLFLLST